MSTQTYRVATAIQDTPAARLPGFVSAAGSATSQEEAVASVCIYPLAEVLLEEVANSCPGVLGGGVLVVHPDVADERA
jgi:hypothetical protein